MMASPRVTSYPGRYGQVRETLEPLSYVVRRSAQRSLGVSPFYVAVQGTPLSRPVPADPEPSTSEPVQLVLGSADMSTVT